MVNYGSCERSDGPLAQNLSLIHICTQPELERRQKELLLEAVEDLWDQGLVVVVSAGNYGPKAGSVAVPGNSRKVITVGVPDTINSYKNLPPVGGRGKIKNYSGRGPTAVSYTHLDVYKRQSM